MAADFLIDNAAHHAQIEPLLPGDGSCCFVLVTNRRRLVELDVVSIDLNPLGTDEAEEMFRRLAERPLTAGVVDGGGSGVCQPGPARPLGPAPGAQPADLNQRQVCEISRDSRPYAKTGARGEPGLVGCVCPLARSLCSWLSCRCGPSDWLCGG
ncbi:MAG TPA: hypothetical protein VFV67_01945, partial [Actinophytocola sp.]|uniref:hypothetical protein n=1 Tax=Actinophytocola sp. TaxID=1872138 RepID=UPI002DB5EB26